MPNCVTQLREEWRAARAAHAELTLMGMPRVNLLISGAPSVVDMLLDALAGELREPIGFWRPGDRLMLPPPALIRTMVLRDVDALSRDEQHHLRGWLDGAAGVTQIVSTTSRPLMGRVEAGTFDEILYYRLNCICVDASA